MLLSLTALAICSLVAVHTVSYGISILKEGNKLGAAGVAALALASVGLPAYYLFLRG